MNELEVYLSIMVINIRTMLVAIKYKRPVYVLGNRIIMEENNGTRK